jgi:hypothetical protein
MDRTLLEDTLGVAKPDNSSLTLDAEEGEGEEDAEAD